MFTIKAQGFHPSIARNDEARTLIDDDLVTFYLRSISTDYKEWEWVRSPEIVDRRISPMSKREFGEVLRFWRDIVWRTDNLGVAHFVKEKCLRPYYSKRPMTTYQKWGYEVVDLSSTLHLLNFYKHKKNVK